MRIGTWLILLGLAAAAHGEPVKETLQVGNLTRAYYVHVPRGQRRAAPALVLAFHGGGGNARQASRSYQLDDIADREGFLVVYPDAIDHHWNDGRVDPHLAKAFVDDVAFVAALIDEMKKAYKIDATRVYATGISNGAMMSHRVAADLSDRIAAIAPVAGGIPKDSLPTFAPTRPVSVLIIQGTRDPLVPYQGGDVTVFGRKRGAIVSTGDAVDYWVNQDGCPKAPQVQPLPDKDPRDGCTTTRYRYGEGREGSEVVLLKVEGGGHTWPGGSQYLPQRTIGKVTHDFEASEAIWDFFKRHHR